MLTRLEIPAGWIAPGTRVISRRQLGEIARAENITRYAKQRARQTIEQAQHDAIQLRKQTREAAFDQAFRGAASAIAQFLANTVDLHQALLKGVREELCTYLSEAGANPVIVRDVLCVRVHPSEESRRLVIHVPADYPHKPELDTLLRERFDEIDWRHSAGPGSYAIEVGGQAWEADFAANADHATQQILQTQIDAQHYERQLDALTEALHRSLNPASGPQPLEIAMERT